MSNIEKIKAEIERQLEYFKGKEDDAWDDCDKYTDEDAQWYQGHWKMCSRLLAFIDSLPEEKPSEDLEKAAKEYASKTLCDPDDGPSVGLAKDAFIAGWNGGIKSQEKKIAEAYEKGKQEGIRIARSWESSPGQCGY